MQKKVIIIQFSSRNGGNCADIGEFLRQYHSKMEVSTYIISNSNLLPCSNCNYECLNNTATCPNRTEYHDAVMNGICSGDLVYYIIPNYCGFPCANFFAFNERKVGFFNGDRALMQKYMSVKKKFIVVSNTENDIFMNAIKQQVYAEPEILYLKTNKYGKNSIAGDLLESTEAKNDLEAFLNRSLS